MTRSDKVRDDLLRRFTAQGVAATSPSEILATVPGDPEVVRELFHHLVRDGHLVRIREGLVVDAAALQELIADIQTRRQAGERFSVGDFKAWTGLTRKHSIPLLEYLDRVRVTRRVGDERERI